MKLANVIYHIEKVMENNEELSMDELVALEQAVNCIKHIEEIHEQLTEFIKKG